MDHQGLWRALDRLAASRGMTISALAQHAGLDPTVFNKSKRVAADGRLRWPGTESLSKVMAAVDCSTAEFFNLMEGENHIIRGADIPCLTTGRVGPSDFDRHGCPRGDGWRMTGFPDLPDSVLYGLELDDDDYAPVFRPGAIVVIAPRLSIRKGDRVAVSHRDGHVGFHELSMQTAHRIALRGLGARGGDVDYAAVDILWMSRIVWSSQ